MAEIIPSDDLAFAREALAAARAAYLAYQKGGNAVVQEYRIGGNGTDRSMKYRDGADLLKQINHWQNQVRILEAAEGFRPRNAQIRVRM
jgi:hypothetical protein